jgi:hypothetical protein
MQRRTLYGGGLGAAGLLLAGTQLVQGAQQLEGFGGTDRALVFAFETAPFLLIGLSLTFIGYWLTAQPEYEPELPRILAWGAGSALLFASVAALFLFSRQVTSHTLEQGEYIATNQVTVGAVVGVLVGLYDARSRLRQRELRVERDRVETFAGKAADINSYGRELDRSETLEEVSSLCIQAVRTSLGITELTVVVTDRGDRELLDNTVVSASEETLLGIAEASLDREPGSVAVDGSPPPSVDGEKQVVSALVAERDELSVVLVALAEEADTPGTEDVELLEMLVAHAATGVERAHERPGSPAEGEAAEGEAAGVRDW